MPNRVVAFFRGPAGQGLASLVRYLYFLRFALLLWALPAILAGLNQTGTRALLSGIVTPVRWVQYLCAAFFLVSCGFVALVLARIVLLHGEERFGSAPPVWLSRFFATEPRESRWLVEHRWMVQSIAPVASQLGTLTLFIYFFFNGRTEGVSLWQIGIGVAAGSLLALGFWYAVSAFYFLSYRDSDKGPARTLIFPRKFLGGKDATKALEDAAVHPLFNFILNVLGKFFPSVGYKCAKKSGRLHEGHYFAAIAFFGFAVLYLALGPLTAPIPTPRMALVALALYELGQLAFLVVVLAASEATEGDKGTLIWWKVRLSLIIFLFAASIPALYYLDDSERFPILALVLILVIFLSWIMGALAFFLDRFRVPVLTLFLLILIAPRMVRFDGGKEEHYLSIALRDDRVSMDQRTPAAILDAKLAQNPSQPLIIVTATGGGIHAAAWTASVLRELEMRFAADPALGSFHGHVLLLSTVSGGSAGLYTYLRELDPKINGGAPNWDRMNTEAECSSLEAVGWGLIYYDIPKAIVPFLPYFVPPSPGVNDLNGRAIFKDRTWALRKAFTRNLDDPYCQLVNAQSDGAINRWIPLSEVEASYRQNRPTGKELTLGNFAPVDDSLPAFTMNTTTVEGGLRFLSANYKVPAAAPDPLNPPPADSFLQVYGGVQFQGSDGKKKYTDLPLATAAQMSATFPYVSSAATFPHVEHRRGVHFVDGGYYDNDGTASAIEFLSSALDNSADARKNLGPLRVILVEIRNSPDNTPGTPGAQTWKTVNPNAGPTLKDPDPRRHRNTPPWNLFNQFMAPLNTFWDAGHESVTSRNRRTLNLLEAAYKDSLVVRQFVIDDRAMAAKNPEDRPPADPLNWSLTPAQQLEVTNSVANADNQTKFENIRQCFLGGVRDIKGTSAPVAPNANQAWQCATGEK